MKPQLVVAGSLNADLVATVRLFPAAGETVLGESFETFCGGKGANQAYAAGKLGARVAMVGQVGNDTYAGLQLENLASVGVDTGHIARDPDHPTGTAIIVVEASKENRIIVIPGANGAFTPAALSNAETLLAHAAAVLLQLEIPLETVECAARLAKTGDALVILDPAPARALPDDLLAHVDYLTPNFSELNALTGARLTEGSATEEIAACARSLCDRGVRSVIAKLGSRGALLVSRAGFQVIAAFRVEAVDTTAAGDCFNAAFATALMEGAAEADAANFAAAAAALSVTRAGAQAGMPSRSEVDIMLRRPRSPTADHDEIL